MNLNWKFWVPTCVHVGRKVVTRKSGIFQGLGRRVFIVTGRRSSKENGSLDDLMDALQEQGLRFIIFDEVEENPSFTTVERAAQICREFGADLVVGLGGGSPMDAAKAVAILTLNPQLSAEDLYDSSNYTTALPVVAIPTTAGTGSEVTQYSVLTNHEGQKGGFSSVLAFPKHAMLDPRYTLKMSRDLTLSTSVDALSHAFEGLLANTSTPLSDTLARDAIDKIKSALPKVLESPDDIQLRFELLLASTEAGMVIAQTGTTLVHAMGYPLTTFKGLKHGMANAILMVPVFEHVAKTEPERVRKALASFKDVEELHRFFDEVGVHDVHLSVSEKEAREWVQRVTKSRHIRKTPGFFTEADLVRIYLSLETTR
ncbi:MAG: alcohol dehydrogenase [Thermotogae bacterium]|nr:iron-containing alcohol dehydrogenase [Thermotogota bacterium]RKX46598.1 MAG: alcohol dehydrogenase [Thermotogota bacterium]